MKRWPSCFFLVVVFVFSFSFVFYFLVCQSMKKGFSGFSPYHKDQHSNSIREVNKPQLVHERSSTGVSWVENCKVYLQLFFLYLKQVRLFYLSINLLAFYRECRLATLNN